MLSSSLRPVPLVLLLLGIFTTTLLSAGETDIYVNIHTNEISAAKRENENSSNHRRVVSVCENSHLRAECGEGQVIRFLEAHYGRLNLATCNHDYNMDWNVNCRSNISEQIMREKCDQKSDCSVEASNLMFGDPCYGTIKYLEMQYMCVTAKEMTYHLIKEEAHDKATTPKVNKPNVKTVCEKSKMQVECDKGKVIHFVQATYGRKTLSKCNPKKNKKFNVKCVSSKSEKIMREKCHRKRSCSVEASNSVFGDPCPKTEKYLEIQYRCVKETATKGTTPKKVTPKRTTPRRTTPRATTPKKITPKRITPKATTPKIITPKKTTPKGTSPRATTTPKGISPRVTTPRATTPKGISPRATTPKLIYSKLTTSGGTTLKRTTPKIITPTRPFPKGTSSKVIFSIGTTSKGKTEKGSTSKGTSPKIITSKGTTLIGIPPKETTPKGTTLKGSTPEGNKPLSVFACEDTKLNIECDRGKVIHFIQANYGRTTLSKCNPNNIRTWNVECLSNKSGEIVRGKCDKKRNCVIEASNSVFGDPCSGTIKYLEIQYMCVSEETTEANLNTENTTPKRTTSAEETTTEIFKREKTTSIESTPEGSEPLSVSACEKTKLNVECDRGKVIHFIKANYGRTTLSKCNPDDIKTLNVKCLSNRSEEIMRQKCDGKRNCVVEVSNSVFGDPCSGTIKYLEMKYLCVFVETTTAMLKTEIPTSKSTTPEARTSLTLSVCENTKLNVECEMGKVIYFLQGNYGRTTLSKCNPNNIKTWNIKCLSKSSGKIMREKCNGKQSCVVEATNSIFGDPCPNTLKYLEMQYVCIPVETTTEMLKTEITTFKDTTPKDKTPLSLSACEHSKLSVECERGEVIYFLQGNYGRTTLSKCNPKNIKTWNVKCLSKNSGKIMKEKCNGKRTCVVEATNSIFGDPCQDTLKYLEMQYLCIPASTISEKIIIPTFTSDISIGITNVVFQSTTKSSEEASPTVTDPTTISNSKTTSYDISIIDPGIHTTAPEISTNNHNIQTNTTTIAIINPDNRITNSDIQTNNPNNGKTVFEVSTKEPDFPTKNPDILTNNPVILTNNPGFPTEDPDNGKTVLEISSKDPDFSTKNPDILTNNSEISIHPDFSTNDPDNHKTVFEVSTKDPDFPTRNPDILTNNPGISTNDPGFSTDNPDKHNTVLEISTNDPFIITTVSDFPTETIGHTTTSHEETSVPYTSRPSNQPSRITTINPPVTECDEIDLKCLKFKCPQDMGNFPHPASKKMFIFCINWKPRIKACARGLVFSEKFTTCVA